MKPLHQALTDARVRSGLTQTEAATLSGINRNHICMMERGTAKTSGINLRTALILGGTYGCTVSQLIGEVPLPERLLNVRERRAAAAT